MVVEAEGPEAQEAEKFLPPPESQEPAVESAGQQQTMAKDGDLSTSKLTSALAYGVSSLALIFTNKITLTTFEFPSFKFLALLQCVCTVICLGSLMKLEVISFRRGEMKQGERVLFSMERLKIIFPLPLLFFLNLVCGLGGTKTINIAMFTALRRFSILMMMVLESVTLGIPFSTPVRISVGVIVLGGLIAASNDLAFDVYGYGLIMGNNVFGALQGVVMKSKLSGPSGKDLGTFGLLYYNSMCSIPVFLVLIYFTENDLMEQLRNYEYWSSPMLMGCLVGSIVLGVVLNYAVFWCTQVNSATTTAVVGSLKNVISGYASILGVGGDYVFSYMNFLGLNISIVGACVYSYFKLLSKQPKKEPQPLKRITPSSGSSSPRV